MKFIAPILFVLISLNAFCQSGNNNESKYFDIKVAGIKIGELKATRVFKDTLTFYTLESKVKLWCVVSVDMHHQIEAVYHGQGLLSSTSISKTNDKTYTSSIIWKDGYYKTNVDSYDYQNTTPIYERIEFNIARFYFEEPVNIRKTLADALGTMTAVKKVKPGNYEVDGQGNVNKFYYENSQFVRASIFSKVRYEVVVRNKAMLVAQE